MIQYNHTILLGAEGKNAMSTEKTKRYQIVESYFDTLTNASGREKLLAEFDSISEMREIYHHAISGYEIPIDMVVKGEYVIAQRMLSHHVISTIMKRMW